ncbi:sodium:alanine symporter family protein [Candidatus Fermentibacteria bacterium]|nr:sodium:alanine symporter family protein [Candidatus Fermentibacteria bacterium]
MWATASAWIEQANNAINGIVWGPYVLLPLLVGVGLYLGVRTRFVQFMHFGRMLKETAGKILQRGAAAEGDLTPFQALTVAMGGTVGVGNIAGVATAIALGGPGAVFWMWVSGLLGMGTKFAEVVLGQHYRVREPGGPMIGGPMTYITRGMGRRWAWLSATFCLFGALAAFGIGNMVQANAVAEGLEHFGMSRWVSGTLIIVSVGLVTLGGIQWIARVATFCVPFMCGMYMLGSLAVIVVYAGRLPMALGLILRYAFTPMAGFGGLLGTTVRYGLARGVFSNEAGLGSAPIAHATARTDHPARQGLWGVFEVFVDTMVMCSATAFVILLTGVWKGSDAQGATMVMHGFTALFSQGFDPATARALGFGLVTLSMILTAYDTNLAWCFYGETCTAYLLKRGKKVRIAYRVLWLPFTLIGAVGGLRLIWGIADTLNGLMAFPNLIALIALAGVVARLTRGFFSGESYQPPQG